jgi:hypothetical protein
MGWRRAVAYDHARRLAAAGLVRTVRMTQGDGSLFVATAAGAARVGYPASWAVRSIGPSNWAHATVCAWVSAWLQLHGHSWWSDREIAGDAFWRRSVRYSDHRGTARITHRPDLAVELTAGPAVIEVEVQRKPRARLLAILRMYADSIDDDDDRRIMRWLRTKDRLATPASTSLFVFGFNLCPTQSRKAASTSARRTGTTSRLWYRGSLRTSQLSTGFSSLCATSTCASWRRPTRSASEDKARSVVAASRQMPLVGICRSHVASCESNN